MKDCGLNVLCVDDDEDHIELLRLAAARESRPLRLHALTKGEEALTHLREGGRPDFILLDYHLPGRDGLSILEELKSDPVLKVIPVLMLSSVDTADHVRRAYSLGANIYFLKPGTPDLYGELIALFITLWTALAVLPTCAESGGECSKIAK